jgi:hypothetical protein
MIGEAKAAGLSIGLDALPAHQPDGNAQPHDSFSNVYRILDFFRGHPKGAARQWAPTANTCEDIHPTVMARYKAQLKGDVWPPSFEAELTHRAKQP